MSYYASYCWPPMPPDNKLEALALPLIQAVEDHGRESDDYLDANRERTAEQVALAARALVRAVDALPAEQRPIGWDQAPEPGDSAQQAPVGAA